MNGYQTAYYLFTIVLTTTTDYSFVISLATKITSLSLKPIILFNSAIIL
jgi:hypothetical protein